MSQVTVTVTIGRNAPVKNSIRQAPMSAAKWAEFRRMIAGALRRNTATVFVADAKSAGEWDGVAEESRTWVASLDDDGWTYDLRDLREELAYLAKRFGQDAIALTTGDTELVTPTTNVDPDTCAKWTHCFEPGCCGPCPGCGNRPGARAPRGA